VAVGAVLVNGAPADAQVTQQVEPGQNITVFHNIDMVAVSGYEPVGSPITVEVLRGGIMVGSSTGRTVAGPDGPGYEVNHVGGACWDRNVPDIRPGDRVRVTHNGDVDEVAVDDIRFTSGPVLLDALGNPVSPTGRQPAEGDRIQLTGVARRADLNPIAAASLDGGEFRDGQYRLNPAVTTDGAGNFTLEFVHPYTPNIKNDGRSVRAAQDALLNVNGLHMIGFGHIAPPPAEAMMIEGLADTPTQGVGCSTPLMADGITHTSPGSVNLAAQAAGTDLVVSGVAVDASSVTVTVDDGDADLTDVVTSPAETPQAVTTDLNAAARPGQQLWTVRIPMAEVLAADLAEGTLSLTPTFTRGAAAFAGPAYTLLKDLTAPAAPASDLASGSYFAPRSVTLTAADPAEETVHYAFGAAAPTATSPVASGPIALTGSPTLRAVSFDRAGNPSPPASWTYEIKTPTAPAAPAGLRVTGSGDGSATLLWNAPEPNGSPILDYVVRWYTAGAAVPSPSVTASSTGVTVSNLTNGTSYTFEVAARNDRGTSPFSARSAAVTPLGLPSAPTISAARAGDGSATVSWTPSASSGGSPITGHVVRVHLAGTQAWLTDVPVGAGDTRVTVPGLANGTSYDFAVRAVSAVGEGPWSGRSNSVTPASPQTATAVTGPSAPGIGRPVRGNASASVSWNPPASTGGSPITGYLVQAYQGGALARTVTVGPGSFNATVTGLRNGQAYTFRVQGLNAAGAGQLSAESVKVVPATVASAPRVGRAAAGKAGGPVTATARWSGPRSNGGSAVTAYQVVAQKLNAKGRVVGTFTSPRRSASSRAYVMRLKPGRYVFRITALNSVGRSTLSSRSNTVLAR
jgi:hypothetical protein